MPFYDFKCNCCGRIFDVFKKSMLEDFSEIIHCEYCGSEDVERSYTSFTMQVADEGIVTHHCSMSKGNKTRVK